MAAGSATRVTVDTTSGGVALWSVPSSAATFGLGAEAVIRNRGSVAVYIGASGVTTSTGFQLDPGESVSLRVARAMTPLYGITGSSSAAVHVLFTPRAEKGVDA